MTQTSEPYDLLSSWFVKLSIESPAHKNHGKRWTTEELSLVIRMHKKGYSAEEIERFLEYSRPLSGIVQRIQNHQSCVVVPIKQLDDQDSTKWIRQWLLKKASAMAAKDTRQSKTGVKYTVGDVLPKILECYRSSNQRRCFFCGRFLMLTTYGSCSQSTLASFDHAIPRMAVSSPGNWFNLTCFMCNLAKHTLTMNQFQLFIDETRSMSKNNDSDTDDDSWGESEASLVRQKHIQWKRKYGSQFVGGDPPKKQQLLDLAKQKGRLDPYTGIKGHYDSSRTDDASVAFRLTFGRIRKKTVDLVTGDTVIHGYYVENTRPMLLIIKYAFYTFSEFEIFAWIQAIRHHQP